MLCCHSLYHNGTFLFAMPVVITAGSSYAEKSGSNPYLSLIASHDNYVSVVCENNTDNNSRTILIQKSADFGKSFENPIPISGNLNAAFFVNLQIVVYGNNVFVAWTVVFNSHGVGSAHNFLVKSTDGG